MVLLYSEIPPLPDNTNLETINQCFHRLFTQADEVTIAVGYISRNALDELDALVHRYRPKNITLTIGMYHIEGMPERLYHQAQTLNARWIESGQGEIRVVTSMKFHGKLYYFSKNNKAIGVINGSANLGVIKVDANNFRQYEVASLITDPVELTMTKALIDDINHRSSENIAEVTDMPLVRANNIYLGNIPSVQSVPQSDVEFYEDHSTEVSFDIPSKVPTEAQRISGEGDYMKSNVNVCYAAPRSSRKPRDWYEIQITVSKAITNKPEYPEKNMPFYVITDDGFRFKAHTTSDGNKQLNAVGDELLIGRWLKGRLASAGLVEPVNDTQADTDRKGMITKEMLEEYGGDHLVLTKTNQQIKDSEDGFLDVWTLKLQ